MNVLGKFSILALAMTVASADLSIRGFDLATLTIAPVTTAEARIGRPLTPLSYAGVARRTTRRIIRRTAIGVSVLPAGCIYGRYYGGYYYRCGAVYYQRSGGVYVRVVVD